MKDEYLDKTESMDRDNSGSERQRAISIDSMQIGDEKKVDSADYKRREHHKMELC